MPEGPIVCNAGPLIALAMAGQLRVLGDLYQRVLVPETVIYEVSGAGAGRVGPKRSLPLLGWSGFLPALPWSHCSRRSWDRERRR